ncbi:hypothetical protein CS022_11860 [Veronia nyctiphanis]|uniref:Uncharacterized protein n=1 Tax=Veronia nyctiphanis TaxID=1278244 RepID=A0A4Q0YS91_9GAMM|nr:hypothetical protein CS022_11860 [Veronia nyctiphanis]
MKTNQDVTSKFGMRSSELGIKAWLRFLNESYWVKLRRVFLRKGSRFYPFPAFKSKFFTYFLKKNNFSIWCVMYYFPLKVLDGKWKLVLYIAIVFFIGLNSSDN